jgi:hypothetical protein
MVRQDFGLASTFDFGNRRFRLAGPDDSAGGLAMPRRRLSSGEWGEVSVSRSPGGSLYRARAWFRDFDGVRRMVERDARTEWAARTALETALASGLGGAPAV